MVLDESHDILLDERHLMMCLWHYDLTLTVIKLSLIIPSQVFFSGRSTAFHMVSVLEEDFLVLCNRQNVNESFLHGSGVIRLLIERVVQFLLKIKNR